MLAVVLLITGTASLVTRRREKGNIPPAGSTLNTPRSPGITGEGVTNAGNSDRAAEALAYLEEAWADDRTTWFDASNVTKEYICDSVILPSDKLTSIPLGEISVEIPGGFTDVPLKITLSEVTDMPPMRDFVYKEVYDIEIEGMDELPDMVGVTFPYDPLAIEDPEDLYPMLWDDTMGWVARPYSVDTDTHTLTMYVNHFTPLVPAYLLTAWAVVQIADWVYDAGKFVHDTETILLSEKSMSPNKLFRIFYDRFHVWQALDPAGWRKASEEHRKWLKDNATMTYTEYIKTVEKEAQNRTGYEKYKAENQDKIRKKIHELFPADIKEKIDSGLVRLGTELESMLSVYKEEGYLTGRLTAYPVVIGLGGESVRTDLAATVANMFINEDEFIAFIKGDANASRQAARKLQRSLFKDILCNYYPFVYNYAKNVSFFFDMVRPFKYFIGEDEYWLNGLYAYVPYTLFIDRSADSLKEIVSPKYLTNAFYKPENNDTAMVPCFIEQGLDLKLSTIVHDVPAARNLGDAISDAVTSTLTVEKIAAACGMSQEEWYCDFVTFIYTKTPCARGLMHIRQGDRYEFDASYGDQYYVEFDPSLIPKGLEILYFTGGDVSIDNGVITVKGIGYVDLVIANSTLGARDTEISLKERGADKEIKHTNYYNGMKYATTFYRFEFFASAWEISPDEIAFEGYDPLLGDDAVYEFEFSLTCDSAEPVSYNIVATINDVKVVEKRNQSIIGGDMNTYLFDMPKNLKNPAPPLIVKIYDEAGSTLLASKTIPIKIARDDLAIEGTYKGITWRDSRRKKRSCG